MNRRDFLVVAGGLATGLGMPKPKSEPKFVVFDIKFRWAEVELDQIIMTGNRIRRESSWLAAIRDSMKRHNGLFKPIDIVRLRGCLGEQYYTLSDGHLRVWAARDLGWTYISALIHEAPPCSSGSLL